MTKTIEYRVRPIHRYVITRFERCDTEGRESSGIDERGEFGNWELAIDTAKMLVASDPGSTLANPVDGYGYPKSAGSDSPAAENAG